MRFLSWLVTLPIFVAALVFILQNRLQVDISFWPFDAEVTMPVSILALGLLILGFFMGSVIAGVSALRASFTIRRLKKEVATLTDKLQKLESKPEVPCSGAAVFSHGRYVPLPAIEESKPSFFARLWKGKKK